MIFRFIVDFMLDRDLVISPFWEPKYPSRPCGIPVRSVSYPTYCEMIAKGYRTLFRGGRNRRHNGCKRTYEPTKPVHVSRKYLKVSPAVDFSGFRNSANLAVSGYTVNGLGELLALRMKMESGVEIEITPEVT